MKYTKQLTFNELKESLTKICAKHKLKMLVIKAKKDSYSDGKISTEIIIQSNKCEIRFYDYKMTNLYCDRYNSPTKFRKTKYSWHVQSNDSIIDLVFADLME
jgi:hypothetical protein